ncbi:MAG: hypothetical protein R2706_11675 [Acidimicrobiales bacterium]
MLIIFEGRGSAGKGGVIKRINERTSPRIVRTEALPKPTEREQSQWYFQRYVSLLLAAGEIVMFDRSWYNRSNVEWVMGYCTEAQHQEFLRTCPEFERMLVRSGIIVLKYWFSVSYESKLDAAARNEEPVKRWKLSEMDLENTGCTTATQWPRTRHFSTPTSSRHRGSSCRRTESDHRGSIASATSCRRFRMKMFARTSDNS